LFINLIYLYFSGNSYLLKSIFTNFEKKIR
jgi:hypothetical protein